MLFITNAMLEAVFSWKFYYYCHNTYYCVEVFICIAASFAVYTWILEIVSVAFLMSWCLGFGWWSEIRWLVWAVVCCVQSLCYGHTTQCLVQVSCMGLQEFWSCGTIFISESLPFRYSCVQALWRNLDSSVHYFSK